MYGAYHEEMLIPSLAVELGIAPSVLEEQDICDIMGMVFYMQAKARKREQASGGKKRIINPNYQ